MGWRRYAGRHRFPGWALRFEEEEEIHCFVRVLQEVAAAHDVWLGVRDDGSSTLVVLPPGSHKLLILDANLDALSWECQHEERIHVWPEIAERYLGGLEELRDFDRAYADLLASFWTVRDMLALRPMPADWAQQPGSLMTWELADGLTFMLVLRWARVSVPVTVEEQARWNIGREELFEIALANTLARPVPIRGEIALGQGGRITRVWGASAFTGIHALRMARYFHPVPPFGILIAVPCPYVVLAHGFDDESVFDATEWLMSTAHEMFAHEPEAISSHLYWDMDGDGRFTELRSHRYGSRIRRVPNQGFEDLVYVCFAREVPMSFPIRGQGTYRGHERPLPHQPRVRERMFGRRRR